MQKVNRIDKIYIYKYIFSLGQGACVVDGNSDLLFSLEVPEWPIDKMVV